MRRKGRTSSRLILCALGIIVGLLVSSPAHAQSAGPIKIGVLHDTTGPLTPQGTELNEGLRLHMSEISHELSGRKIQLVFEDTESKADAGMTKARKLVERDSVHLLIGPANSALAYAVRDYVDQNRVPTVLTQATAKDLTQGKTSPYLFRISFGSEQLHMPAAWYAYKKLGYRRAILVALDPVAGREPAGGFLKTCRQLGGAIGREVYAPRGTADWAPYVTRVKADLDKVDVVEVILWGPDAIRFVKGYAEYGLKGVKPIFSHGSLVDEAFLPSEGDAALGIMNYLFYTPSLETPENQRFKELFRKQYNKEPTSYHEMGYVAAKTVTEAIRKVNGRVEDVPRVLDALRRTRFEAPQGLFRLDEKQNAVIDLHIRRVEKVGGKLTNVYLDKIPDVDQFWNPPQQ
jgi:branched-chain amino acid transport system substrate-binding protein